MYTLRCHATILAYRPQDTNLFFTLSHIGIRPSTQVCLTQPASVAEDSDYSYPLEVRLFLQK